MRSETVQILAGALPIASKHLGYLGTNYVIAALVTVLLGGYDILNRTYLGLNLSRFEQFRQSFLSGTHDRKQLLYENDIFVTIEGKEHLPKDGKFQFLLNHPTGILDGVIALSALDFKAEQLQLVANNFLQIFDPHHVFLKAIRKSKNAALQIDDRIKLVNDLSDGVIAGKPLVMYPAGSCSKPCENGHRMDPERKTTALRVAHQTQQPIMLGYIDIDPADYDNVLPGNIGGLKRMEVFFRVLFTKNNNIRLHIRPPIYAHDVLSLVVPGYTPDASINNVQYKEASQILRNYLYTGELAG